MTQFLRPDGNIDQTNWTNGFAEIDEVTPSDSDYAWSANNTAGATLRVSTSNPSGAPGSGTVTIRWRGAKTNNGTVDGGGSEVTVQPALWEGSNVIASPAASVVTGTWQEFSFTVNSGDVGDWSNVSLRWITAGGGGSPANRRGGAVSWAVIELPDPAAVFVEEDLEPAGGALRAGQRALSGALAAAAVTAQLAGGFQFNDDIIPPPPPVVEETTQQVVVRTSQQWRAPIFVQVAGNAEYSQVQEDEYQPPKLWVWLPPDIALWRHDGGMDLPVEPPAAMVDEEGFVPQVVWNQGNKLVSFADEDYVTPPTPTIVEDDVWQVALGSLWWTKHTTFIGSPDEVPQIWIDEENAPSFVVWPQETKRISLVDEEIVPQPVVTVVDEDIWQPGIIWPPQKNREAFTDDSDVSVTPLTVTEDAWIPRLVVTAPHQRIDLVDPDFVGTAPPTEIVEDEPQLLGANWAWAYNRYYPVTGDEITTPLGVDEIYHLVLPQHKVPLPPLQAISDEAVWVAPPFVPIHVEDDYWQQLVQPKLWWKPPVQAITDTDPKVPQAESGTVRLEGITSEILYLVPPQPVRNTKLDASFMGTAEIARARNTWTSGQWLGGQQPGPVKNTFLHAQWIAVDSEQEVRNTFLHVQIMRDNPNPSTGEPEPPPPVECPTTEHIPPAPYEVVDYECVVEPQFPCVGIAPEVRITLPPEEPCPPIEGEPLPPGTTPPEEEPFAVGSVTVSSPAPVIMTTGQSYMLEVLVMSVEVPSDTGGSSPEPLQGRTVMFTSSNPLVASVPLSAVTNAAGIAQVPVSGIGIGPFSIFTECENVIGETLTGAVTAPVPDAITGIGGGVVGFTSAGVGTVTPLVPGAGASKLGMISMGVGSVGAPPAYGSSKLGLTSSGSGSVVNPSPPPPPPPTDGSGANEPAGMVKIASHAFDTLLTGGVSSFRWFNLENTVKIDLFSDPTEPVSPSSTIRWTWPVGPVIGGTPGFHVWFSDKDELYFAFRLKVSSPFTYHPSGVNKLGFIGLNRGTESPVLNNEIIFILYGTSEGNSHIRVATQIPGVPNRWYSPNVVQTVFTANVWHEVEIYLKRNSVGVSDGVVKIWVDGTLNAQYFDAVIDHAMNVLLWQHYWGGQGPYEHVQEDYMWDGHLYLSGLNAGIPPDVIVDSVAVTPSSATGVVGGSITLAADPRDAAGNHVAAKTVGWATSNPLVATVGADSGTEAHQAIVNFVGAGDVTITATCDGKVGTCGITLTAPPPPTQKYFDEDWSLGHFGRNMGGFRWGERRFGVGDGLAVNTVKPYPGKTFSCEFLFGGEPLIMDRVDSTSTPQPDAWSELRFIFGQQLREFFMKWWWYYPGPADGALGTDSYKIRNNYSHAAQLGSGTVGPTNNKFLRVWDEDYNNRHVGCGMSVQGFTNQSQSALDQNGQMITELFWRTTATATRATAFTQFGPWANVLTPATRGTWQSVQVHAKLATTIDSGDGVWQLWINDVLRTDLHNLDFISHNPGGLNYFRNGYLNGWANSGFDNNTKIFVGRVIVAPDYIEDV